MLEVALHHDVVARRSDRPLDRPFEFCGAYLSARLRRGCRSSDFQELTGQHHHHLRPS